MMLGNSLRLALAALAATSFSIGIANARHLTLGERVQAQTAIERVYWAHRIWPKGNPGARPSFEASISEAAILAKVKGYLQKTRALDEIWDRPIIAQHLQAEMIRMARDTRQPDLLGDLFDALGDDPFVIAECLARPILADRLARNAYAYDDRFHGATKRRAEAALARSSTVHELMEMGARYGEVVWRVSPDGEESRLPSATAGNVFVLSAEEWNAKLRELEFLFPDSAPASSLGESEITRSDAGSEPVLAPHVLILETVSPLQESDTAFFATAVLESGPDHVRTATVSWPKRPFDEWWRHEGASFSIDGVAPAFSYVPVLPSRRGCARSWLPIRYGVTDARSFHTAVWTGAEMIVWGGFGSDYLLTGGRYDPATDTWTPTSTGTHVPSARLDHTAVWTGREMIVWGGRDRSTKLNTGGRYDPTIDAWESTRTDPVTPEPRRAHTAVWTGHEMIVWGGTNDSVSLGTGGRYDPVTDGWTTMSAGPSSPGARWGHTAVWTGVEMIVWGGAGRLSFLNTGGRYDPLTDMWQPTGTGPGVPSSRFNSLAVWTGREMIAWGGFSRSTWTNTGGRYDPVTDAWTLTSTGANVPLGAQSQTAVWARDEMIVWGGFNGAGARYSPNTDSWSPTDSGNEAPFARQGHTAVWTGDEMIVWGGRRQERLIPTYTGGRYDPAKDAWIPTGVGAEVPTPRWSHTAVWTGSEMIVWGGSDSWPPQNSGGRYRPATDSWSPTSVGANVPSARRSHVAVWTGREMIVWGGDGEILLTSGARYNPGIDRWRPITSVDAPTPRTGPTVVWTGKEMIVWGGYDYDLRGPTDTGGRYDPRRDRWVSTPTGESGPRARLGHSAVWTGREMIVWGGVSPGGATDSGDRYSPKRNTWRPGSSAAGVIAPRSGHSAVWTGREMIVFGGATPAVSDAGARYDPTVDAWTRIGDAAGAPTGRSSHTAIWTGKEMIVWGGSDGAVSLNTGGRYDPSTDRWFPTSIGPFVPVGHILHTAVWSGRKMIVWGGSPAPSSTGSYCTAGRGF